jgi:hypothetical protein
MATQLRRLMENYNFKLVIEGEEICRDEDWSDASGEGVKCWWSVWCWDPATMIKDSD